MKVEKKERKLENYILSKKKLGDGTYGVVYLAHEETTNQPVAIKQINVESFPKKLLEAVESEKDTLRSVKHPNIIKLFDIYQNSTKVFFVTEFCGGGDLSQFIASYKTMDENLIKKIIFEIASGLSELHYKKIVHRDLKPANILLSNKKNPSFKIADFGFAKFIDENILSKTICGTVLYMAPEIIKGTGYDQKVDLWSLGVMWYELIYKRNPFSKSTNKQQFLQSVISGNIEFEDVNYSKECIELIKKLLEKDPKKRISIFDLLKDSYFNFINEDEEIKEKLIEETNEINQKMEMIISFNSDQLKKSEIIENYLDQF
eukprot:gene8167-12627_t